MNVDALDDGEHIATVWANDRMKVIFARPIYGPMRYDPERNEWERMDSSDYERAQDGAYVLWNALQVQSAVEKWKADGKGGSRATG